MIFKQNRSVRLAEYLEFAIARPELFDNPQGGVRIILDPAEIVAVEEAVACDLKRRGLPADWASVGIVFQDPWIFVLRDAVEFPDGSRRTYARVVNRIGNGAGALPVLEGRIVLVRHFRHAVRRWLLEVPRGGIEPGATAEETARRETQEELGARVGKLLHLGFLHGSTNLYGSGAHLFFAEIESVGSPQIEEGITAIEQLTPKEFEARLLAGEIRDSFTVAAYTHAKLRGLI
jgi:ADP-ribose pyrophosphatase